MKDEKTMEKRIEEMAKTLGEARGSFCCNYLYCSCCPYNGKCIYQENAKLLVNAGYRKASEVAEEIFAEIIEALVEERIAEERKANSALEAQDTASYEVYSYAEDKLATIILAISLYKKKYTEGGE